VQKFDVRAAINLKACRDRLSKQQYKTLKGQILAGDSDGAMKGLRKLLLKTTVKP
jgi:hypothetical protein